MLYERMGNFLPMPEASPFRNDYEKQFYIKMKQKEETDAVVNQEISQYTGLKKLSLLENAWRSGNFSEAFKMIHLPDAGGARSLTIVVPFGKFLNTFVPFCKLQNIDCFCSVWIAFL